MSKPIAEEIKTQIMVDWSLGMALNHACEKHGVHYQTAVKWKKADNPMPWDQFKERIVREQLSAVVQELRVQAAEQVGEHWKDMTRMRKFLRTVTTKLENSMAEFDKSVDGPLPPSMMESYTDQARKILASFKSLQEQQMNAMGLKFTQIEAFNLNDKENQQVSDAELDAMNPEQLLELATGQLTGETETVDVTPN